MLPRSPSRESNVVDSSSPLSGTVFEIQGKEASVHARASGRAIVLQCYLRGRLFEADAENEGTKNQVVVGDEVELDPIGPVGPLEGTGPFRGVIHRVLERKTALVRRTGTRKPRLQVLAANVDGIVVVSALAEPHYKTGLIDRYLVLAHDAGIAPALCLNKIDLGDERALAKAREDLSVYASLGYPLAWTSVKRGDGLEDLRAILAGKRSVLVGHSGVGKSKLAGWIQPGVLLSSGEVDRHGKGRHTTTRSRLFPLDFGGELVDTPGVRELSLHHVDRARLARQFVEMRPFVDHCRFTVCSHIPEPDCRVKEAVDRGEIAKARYESYVRLFEELR
jgi:ribosome biogenesis GTPase / thiamine phosphate phosphatase